MHPRSRLAVGLAAVLFAAQCLWPASASALVRQPDGTMVPVGDSLRDYLRARGETIDVTNDAAVEPQRFIPGCSIRFTVVARDSGYENSFGWYNVQAGRAPTNSELFELVSTTAGEGFTATLDLRTDPRYAGGEIGFYLRTPPPYVYYSERAYQPDTAVSGGFVHVVIYDSRVTPNAFYFAWEDLFNGGDNDFQDLLMIVDNLVCAGGGAPCDTMERGVCAQGVRQCRSGALACVRTTAPSMERCDGLDNDCNGMTDEGAEICPAGRVCERGVCVDRCVEMSCFPGEVCTSRGTCVERACEAVSCADGERCVGGRCMGACEGVMCPHGQVCRVGRCIDLCAGLTCDAEQLCVDGVCQARCPCHRCAAGTTCAMDGRCVSTGCEAVTCPAGSFCEAGACHDACASAVCPAGQACSMGACRDVAGGDAGVSDGGAGGDAGAGIDAATGSDSGTPRDGSATLDARVDGGTSPGASSGCGCRVTGAPSSRSSRGGAVVVLGALLALGRARRRRAARG